MVEQNNMLKNDFKLFSNKKTIFNNDNNIEEKC